MYQVCDIYSSLSESTSWKHKMQNIYKVYLYYDSIATGNVPMRSNDLVIVQ